SWGHDRAADGENSETKKTIGNSQFAPLHGPRYSGETSNPARRPSAGAMPGRCGFCLAAKRTGPRCSIFSVRFCYNGPITRPMFAEVRAMSFTVDAVYENGVLKPEHDRGQPSSLRQPRRGDRP